MLIVAASFTVILFVTDLIISGYYSIGYSITAHREQYYFAYQAYVIGLIIVSLILLIKTYLSSNDKTLKAQCFYLSLGFLAPFLTIFTVTILMQLGYKINMLMLLPISTAIFVIFVVKCENEHKLIDMKRLLPWSKENKFSAQVNLIANRFAESELDLKAANKEFERLLLLHCKNKGYSKRRSAKLLGIGTSTLYYKLEKFEIDWKD
jgi:hypothetical protein